MIDSMSDRLKLWIARGFDSGKFPIAPGTAGSFVGVLWFVILVSSGHYWIYIAGNMIGILLSVRLCGEAEIILGKRDPESVVLDEIVAVPICYVSWMVIQAIRSGHWLEAEELLGGYQWIFLGIGFVLFRAFDIVKPWPVRQSQNLPSGLGVTLDDLLAAVYVNAVMIPVAWWGAAARPG